jgi:HD domain-containing protein
MPDITASWRRAGEPVAAHHLAEALLPRASYERSRGVAQQAARIARAARLARDRRARLLCAAWLHDTGRGLAPGGTPRDAARALRRAGHEPLARIVAHAAGAAVAAAIAGGPPLAAEFPAPAGAEAGLLTLLDVAVVTTSPSGAPATPAGLLRGTPEGDARRVLVAVVARLADDTAARALVEHIAPRAAAGQ